MVKPFAPIPAAPLPSYTGIDALTVRLSHNFIGVYTKCQAVNILPSL